MPQAISDSTPASLTIGDLKRVQEAVRAFERLPTSKASLPEGRVSGREFHFAVVTVEITAFNASTKLLGTGKAKLQYRDPADRKLKDYSPNVVVDVENDIVGTVAVGSQIKIHIMDGAWVVYNAGCG